MATVGTLTVQMTLTSVEFEKGLREAQRLTAQGTNVIVRTVDQAGRSVQGATRGMAESFTRAAVSVRTIVTPLTSELMPALGGVTQGLGAAIGAARGFGLAGGLVAAAGVVAVQGLTQYIDALTRASQLQATLNIAVRSFDAGAIRSAMTTATLEIEKAATRASALREAFSPSRIFGEFKEDVTRFLSGGLGAAAAKAKADVTDIFTGASAAQKDRAAAQAAMAQVLPLEAERQLTEQLEKQAQATAAVIQLDIRRAQGAEDVAGLTAEHQKLWQVLNDQFAAEIRLVQLRAQADRAAAATRGEPVGLVDAQLKADESRIATQHLARMKQFEEQRRAAMAATVAPFQAKVAAETQNALDQFIAGQQTLRDIDEERLADAQRILQLDADRLAIMGQMSTLTRAQALDVEQQRIEAERRAAQADPAFQKMAPAMAEAKRTAIDTQATLRQTALTTRDQQETTQGLLEIEAERLRMKQQFGTLSRTESEELERQRIEAERRAALADPRLAGAGSLEEAARSAVNYRAELQQTELATREWREISQNVVGELKSGFVELATATENWGETAGRVAQRVAATFLDNVLNRALRPAEDALIKFVEQMAKAGLGVLTPTGATTTVPVAGDYGTGLGTIGATAYASGGIVTRPTLGLVGEKGPEAIVPLDQYQGGWGGGGTVVNIIDQRSPQAPQAEVRETMRDGKREIEILIADTVDKAMAGGRFDRSLSTTYGVQRRGVRG